jgi:hypothetical protein
MGLEKLIKKLGDYLEGKKDSCDEIRELLEKLEHKQKKAEKKLADEDRSSKRKALKLELKIIKAQQKKAEKLIKRIC